ncbi:reverse transcriptase, partial [Salmonella enterica subsp. enterica serovar Singapore]|nr:reverse transcriptase [Salmonella enterica subsp. enterica serovar Singapore]
DIWLQRISYHINRDIEYKETLCSIVSGVHDRPHEHVWSSEWISDNNFKNNIMATSFVDDDKLQACEPIIQEEEVTLFPYDSDVDEEDLE